jgi:quercetin dioxygenase-like cupin family protein
MKINVTASVIVCCTALGAAIPVEPSATLIDNNQVTVLRALEKAHVKSAYHEHKQNRVMVYLQSGRQRFEYQDGRPPATFDWKAGEVKWSPPEGMHSPEVLSDASFNIIEVLLKTAGSSAPISSKLDPLRVDPKHYKLEFENPQVRVVRVKVEPHGVTPMHEHPLNRVTVFLTDQDFRVKDSNGKVETVKHKAGDAVWGGPITHTEQNLTDQPFEAIAIEIKG